MLLLDPAMKTSRRYPQEAKTASWEPRPLGTPANGSEVRGRGYRVYFQGYNQDAASSEVSSGKLREAAEKLPND
jgi:hypothetical protein